MAWEGERTVTFTMEDALISPVSFSILSGAGLIEANKGEPIIIHKTEQTDKFVVETHNTSVNASENYVEITLTEKPYLGQKIKNAGTSLLNSSEDFIYVMVLDENGEVISEPYIAVETDGTIGIKYQKTTDEEPVVGKKYFTLSGTDYNQVLTPSSASMDNYYELVDYPVEDNEGGYKIRIYSFEKVNGTGQSDGPWASTNNEYRINDLTPFTTASAVLVDYYVAHESGAYQIDITPDKFGGNFYLEASTLFRAENGQDMPAEFIIPNCKIQSNFTFTMASSGDPSTFTFTMDAFPDYTRWNKSKKVFAAIQVINTAEVNANELERLGTGHDYEAPSTGEPYQTYKNTQKQFIEID